ncbi:AMP-dependent synthetase/ligase [Gordonia sp. CPCC 206044]|uniref:AMP-dependent synthetase/ligase n=1 Tax=Gordonia sp. CPCC 206044 TaxID=3140793 RepID=UPI003AF3FA9E
MTTTIPHPDEALAPCISDVGTVSIPDALRYTAARCADRVAARSRDGSTSWTWAELGDLVDRAAAGLGCLGVRRGHSVALLLTNRPEFMAADLAVMCAGATPFSIYNTSAADQIDHMITDSAVRVAITERRYVDQILAGANSRLSHLVVIDDDTESVRDSVELIGLSRLLALGAQALAAGATLPSTGPDDIAVVIYTSGTTGVSKGVQLSHHNVLTSCECVNGYLRLPDAGRVISWLPTAHMAERVAHYYMAIMYGLQVTYCPDVAEIGAVVAQVRPCWFFAVPRVWEKMKSGIEVSFLDLPDDDRDELARGLEASLSVVRHTQNATTVPAETQSLADDADRKYFAPLRHRLGLDQVRALFTGAAATPREVAEFFHALGLHIGELWGLSESSAAGTMNPADAVKIGSVGPAMPGVEIRIQDGEIQLRGEFTMVGYRNLPQQTADAFSDDGWLRTGDLGRIDDDGYVHVLGRIKELIINSSGKNMSPVAIEDAIGAESPLIGQIVVVGDRRNYNVALVVLDADHTRAWANARDLDDVTDLHRHDDLRHEIAAAVERGNAKLSRVEQVKRFHVLGDEWQPGSTELTPTMKLRRHAIADKYAAQIDDLYSQ